MSTRPPHIIKLKPNTIILLHGFNSAPGNKAEAIEQYLKEKQLEDDYLLIAAQLPTEPRKAIREINQIIRQHKTGKVYVMGTSLGGFYANYFRAKFMDDQVIVHAINPSWEPSVTLKRAQYQELTNFKTNEKWFFKPEYIDQLKVMENFILENLKNYIGDSYFLHLAENDELLDFSGLLSYLQKEQVPHKIFHYNTNHRFEKMEELLKLIYDR
jgi:predicted esterase YcpF (UPF0227 family)